MNWNSITIFFRSLRFRCKCNVLPYIHSNRFATPTLLNSARIANNDMQTMPNNLYQKIACMFGFWYTTLHFPGEKLPNFWYEKSFLMIKQIGNLLQTSFSDPLHPPFSVIQILVTFFLAEFIPNILLGKSKIYFTQINMENFSSSCFFLCVGKK